MAVSKRLRYEILRRDKHTCRYCGAHAPDVPLRVDHVLPVALGGSDHPSNLATSCDPCNNGKSSTIEGHLSEAPDVRGHLSAATADELVRLWVTAYQVHTPGDPSLKLVDEVRESIRDAHRLGIPVATLRDSATHCGLIGETFVGLGETSLKVREITAQAFQIWRTTWRRASGYLAWPDMTNIFLLEASVEAAVDGGADRMSVLRAAALAGWAMDSVIDQYDEAVTEAVVRSTGVC
ncbi:MULTISPECIES: HNH endonuclease [unclassified Streptomyces]|uniref:HNH endonuclease n=1 Tax=unclassified Streptomyces TaxID=2593676 RepID=UPI00081DC898|nr:MULTISPECIES: HNH endonuclease [unclassified Streptomyces]MYR30536.1 hypothetical protein [Streptomyces sp. SID4945]SCF50060.1 HNH endonuclease [Streptomyces sp. LcepLS]